MLTCVCAGGLCESDLCREGRGSYYASAHLVPSSASTFPPSPPLVEAINPLTEPWVDDVCPRANCRQIA